MAQLYKSKATYTADYETLVEDIDSFIKYIDEIKKEYRTHRKFWTNLSEYILRIDELNQAQTQYVVTIDNHITGDVAEMVQSAINSTISQFLLDQNLGEKKLSSTLDRLKYFKNLKNSLKDKDSIHSRMCSICWCDLEEYFLLTCGHFFCTSCLAQIRLLSAKSDTIKCSVCRAVCRKDSPCAISSLKEIQDKIEGKCLLVAVLSL